MTPNSRTSLPALVVWQHGPAKGSVEVAHGRLDSAALMKGEGRIEGSSFDASSPGEVRLLLRFAEARIAEGACPTRVTLNTKDNPFTFFLRDVNREFPIFIPEYGVIVTEVDDKRSYDRIVASIRNKKLVSQLGAIENAPEESYEAACRDNRALSCPTWLGLSRDMRIFEVNPLSAFGYWGYVRPRYHSTTQRVSETDEKPYALQFAIGPGASCCPRIVRRLEEGVLPILHSTQTEEDVRYELTIFVTQETRPLSLNRLRGSDWLACYANTGGNMLAKEDEQLAKLPDKEARSVYRLRQLRKSEKMRRLLDLQMREREEETVCWIRIEATNRGKAPRYAWFRGLTVNPDHGKQTPTAYNAVAGFGHFQSSRVFGVHRLNGRPAPEHELAVMLRPGKTAAYEILIPHQPLSRKRAAKLAGLDFQTHIAACRKFWKAKLRKAASVSLPEPAIDERVKAGLLHCDLVALGRESRGPVLPTIGWYAPIGSESSPIIQFFDSMGWHDLAERCLEFFLERQREDGFIQNFGGYQLETGPALWTMGEHYRYTRDKAWVKRIRPKLLKACDYLLAWRERNKKPELRRKGYGLLDGKVADPEDYFHSFMLNALSYLGIQRTSEMLAEIDPAQSRRLADEAAEFRKDIRAAYYQAIGHSPAIPLSDGTWVPSVPPWAEYPGALALYADGGNWFTHGAFGARDSLIGALYLVIGEVLGPTEVGTDFLLKSHQQLFTVKNAGLSQPYYCRHDYIHLARGEVKSFLKTYYNQFTALQDRETYTFWEHYFHASQHKTHEEGWFLMQTRWMLLMEEGSTLHMLRGIPRTWMEHGKRLAFDRMKTHFGPVSLHVDSRVEGGTIQARYTLTGRRRPEKLVVRLPHPTGCRPKRVSGGSYTARNESVEIASPPKSGVIVLRF